MALRELLLDTRTEARNRALNRALADWLPQVPLLEVECRGKTVVFNTVRSNPGSFHLYTDLFIGHLLARNGGRAVVLLDDGVLAHWDTVQRFRTSAAALHPMRARRRARAMKRNATAAYEVFKTPGLELKWYSELPARPAEEPVDADVERYALASTLRYFERGFFQPEDPEQGAYYGLSLENAKVSKAVGRFVAERMRPDLFATSHGIYSTWGPAYSLVKGAGGRTAVYAQHPYHLGGLMIDDAPGGSLDRAAMAHYLCSADFPEGHRAAARAYLEARYSHHISDTHEYFDGAAASAPGLERFSGSGYRLTFGLFPNVAWDAIGDHLKPVFPSVIDWIAESVRAIVEQGLHRLIVRFHPAEVTRLKGTVSTERLLRERLPDIDRYPNVVLVPASDRLSSYDLLRDAVDVALVYTGTLGAEAQPLGVPVVSVASGRFSEGFVHIASGPEAYLAILRDPQPVIEHFANDRERIVDSVLKYHYYLSEELFYPLPLLSRKGRRAVDAGELRGLPPVDGDGLRKTLQRFVA